MTTKDNHQTRISWTHRPGTVGRTWNPVLGCTKVAAGCQHCYAMHFAHRFSGQDGNAFHGLTKATSHGPEWTGEVRMFPDRLAEPLRWRQPSTVFVPSMSDLFHDAAPPTFIAQVLAVMAWTPMHTYLLLTKRPERARSLFDSVLFREAVAAAILTMVTAGQVVPNDPRTSRGWPLRNVWLGTSVAEQRDADANLPHLLATPAAVRFVSYEPAVGPVDFRKYLGTWCSACGAHAGEVNWCNIDSSYSDGHHVSGSDGPYPCGPMKRADELERVGVDWLIVGGESGHHARPFDLTWARSVVQQGAAAGVPVFVKQLGSNLYGPEANIDLFEPTGNFRTHEGKRQFQLRKLIHARNGDDPAEWPADLRVQQFPEVRA